MTTLLALHLLSLGLWIGCIATEAVFEHTTGREPGLAGAVAALHVKVDLWVEVPAFVLVLVTGAAMLPRTDITLTFFAKIAVGLAAIGVNATLDRSCAQRRHRPWQP